MHNRAIFRHIELCSQSVESDSSLLQLGPIVSGVDDVSAFVDDLNRNISNKQGMQHNVILDPNDPTYYVGKRLSDDDKFKLLTSRFEFPNNFNFPVTLGRRFNPIWMASRAWLRYSIKNDRAYYNSCLCFH